MITLGAYIQVPFCQTKCTYCNFHTGVVSRELYAPYVAAVCREIAESASDPGSSAIDTIYVGGGTPTLLDPAALARILDALRAAYRVASLEVTLEADPETISPIKAAAWLDAGFNRISLGSQSFDDRELRAAGRMHRREHIFRAVETLRDAGFRNISMDLIAGLPHQTRESWERSVTELLRIYPEHVSIYMLEVDEGSRLGKEVISGGQRYSADTIPSDDAQADFYESACARLAAGGYNHYEISNWGVPGRESLHNLKYWRRQPYIGFGAGAHSFDGTSRWANIHDPVRYVTCIERGTSTRELLETLSPMHALHEEFFLGLRRLEGIDLARIESEFNPDPLLATRLATLHQRIDMLRAHGFLDLEAGRLRIPPDRLTISNEVFLELLG